MTCVESLVVAAFNLVLPTPLNKCYNYRNNIHISILMREMEMEEILCSLPRCRSMNF